MPTVEQWERLDEVRAHTGKYIQMVDVDPRLDAAVASICERQQVAPMEHMSTDIEIYVDSALAEILCKVERSHSLSVGS